MGDFICQLPNDVSHCIFTFLPVRDVIRVSAVSHKWLDFCSSYLPPELHLNWLTMFNDGGKYNGCSDLLDCMAYKQRFIRGVNQLLKFYCGKHVPVFTISFCLGCDYARDLDQWVGFAVTQGVEAFSLELLCPACRPKKEQLYVFCSDPFEGTSINLRKLKVDACILGPNFGRPFGCLEELFLGRVPLAAYDLESMFSALENLKELTLRRCILPAKLCLGSLCQLRAFTTYLCQGVREIDICNMSLQVFTSYAPGNLICDFNAAPNLQRLHSSVTNEPVMGYIFSHLSRQLPNLKHLTICSSDEQVQRIPERASAFKYLRVLRLSFMGDFEFEPVKVVDILKLVPSLLRLSLMTQSSENSECDRILPSPCKHKHLKIVKFGGFRALREQIQLAKYLLKNAIRLKRLVLKRGSPGSLGNKEEATLKASFRQNIRQKLQKFSKRAEVIF